MGIYENDVRWQKAVKGVSDLEDLYECEYSLCYAAGLNPDRVKSVQELKEAVKEAKTNLKRLEEKIRRERVKEAEELIKQALRDLV